MPYGGVRFGNSLARCSPIDQKRLIHAAAFVELVRHSKSIFTAWVFGVKGRYIEVGELGAWRWWWLSADEEDGEQHHDAKGCNS